ncbi:hypothetical protein L6R53_20385 [Myxococcota bacterium]|nr:hypothetical protein [Myxococcota bacterium]
MTLLALLACSPLSGDLSLTDDHNYLYTASMQAETTQVAAWQDVRVDWSALSVDLQQRPVDPTAIDRISLVRMSLDADEVLQSVADSSLNQSDVIDYRLLDDLAGRTDVMLSEMAILGNPFDPAQDFAPAEDGKTWILSLWDLERSGRDDILTSMILDPSEASDVVDVAFTDSTASFGLVPDLHSGLPLETSEGAEAYSLEWSSLTRTGAGLEFDPLLADRLVILHFAEDLTTVESDFIALANNDAQAWRADVYGLDSLDLAEAASEDGEAFPGFDRDGTWLIGLECTSCTNPVPLALAVVDVRR